MAGRLKRAIGGIYSYAADRFYEPVVVRGAFKLFGGRLHEMVLEQGRDAVERAAGGPILDMPVGTGFFTITTARLHDGVIVGVDLAEGMVVEARRAARREGVDNIAMARADAHNLPFADGTFAGVLCNNGLQVIPGTHRALEELVRVLAPNGTLFISVVGIPLSAALPAGAADHLPALFKKGGDFVDMLRDLGLRNFEVARSRLAWTITATR